MKNILLLSILVLALTSCKKKDAVTRICPLGYTGANCDTNIASKFVGNYLVHDTGYFSWTMQSGTDPCYQTFIINRNHSSQITLTGGGTFNVSNFFGDSGTVSCFVNSAPNNFITSSNIPIKYGGCPNGFYMFQGNNRPAGYISSDGKTIIISGYSDFIEGAGNSQSWHYKNNFISTFIRQ